MLYVNVDSLSPGMVLARELPSDFLGAPLVTVGQPLTERIINRIQVLGIPGAYISSGLCDDVDFDSDDILKPEVQKKIVNNIKQQFNAYMTQSLITDDSLNAFYSMSDEIVTNVLSSNNIILNMVNIKRYDDYTYEHSAMVGLISTLIGTKLGMSSAELRSLATCGLMHDIGKLDVPSGITNKPDRLTPAEMSVMKNHPSYAVERLRNNRSFNFVVLRGIECHHEKYDGTGYPHGLSGTSIPLYGRILALADVYDALISKRIYRDGWTALQALDYMTSMSGIYFDPELLSIFLSVIAAYPVGTIIKLSNGYTCVVTGTDAGSPLRPRVRALSPATALGTDIDLAEDPDYLSVVITDVVTDLSLLPKEALEPG